MEDNAGKGKLKEIDHIMAAQVKRIGINRALILLTTKTKEGQEKDKMKIIFLFIPLRLTQI